MGVRIGITCSFREEEYGLWLRAYYIDKLVCSGATPFVLPPVYHAKVISDFVETCDGFLFAGGGDMDPAYWGQDPEPGLGEIDPRRDEFEFRLAQHIIEKDIPVLGICRGVQVLNVAAGGSLVQDIKGGLCHVQKAPPSYPFHDILIKKGTRLFGIVETDKIRVNSFHHQAVGKLGKDLIIAAVAKDGVIEAIESTRHRFFLGVQWHPECMTDSVSGRLFQSLVEAAAN